MTLMVRTSADPLTSAHAAQSTVREIDPEVLLLNLRPMSHLVAEDLRERRLLMTALRCSLALRSSWPASVCTA